MRTNWNYMCDMQNLKKNLVIIFIFVDDPVSLCLSAFIPLFTYQILYTHISECTHTIPMPVGGPTRALLA